MIPIAARSTQPVARSADRTRRMRLLILPLLVGLVAPLLSIVGSAHAVALPTRARSEISIDWTIFDLINAERAVNGLAPLHMSGALRNSARAHNVTMARTNTMSHQLPGEAVFTRRMTAAGYTWHWAGENIAWNSSMTTAGVVMVQKLMYNEKAPNNGHRLNILNRQFKDVGVDVYMDRAHHKVWLTTDFGRH